MYEAYDGLVSRRYHNQVLGTGAVNSSWCHSPSGGAEAAACAHAKAAAIQPSQITSTKDLVRPGLAAAPRSGCDHVSRSRQNASLGAIIVMAFSSLLKKFSEPLKMFREPAQAQQACFAAACVRACDVAWRVGASRY